MQRELNQLMNSHTGLFTQLGLIPQKLGNPLPIRPHDESCQGGFDHLGGGSHPRREVFAYSNALKSIQ